MNSTAYTNYLKPGHCAMVKANSQDFHDSVANDHAYAVKKLSMLTEYELMTGNYCRKTPSSMKLGNIGCLMHCLCGIMGHLTVYAMYFSFLSVIGNLRYEGSG